MDYEIATASPPTPVGRGPKRKYLYHILDVGQMFFVPNRETNNMVSHASAQGRRLGRKFATRLQWMRKDVSGAWVQCMETDRGAVKGIGVYRTE